MTHGKKSKTIYTDLKYNRYMTDDRNRKSGKLFPNFVIMKHLRFMEKNQKLYILI